MAKKIVGLIKLQVPAGKANPSPPIGPALGQRGLNIMEFCKAFNAQTQKVEPGLPLPVVITAFADKSFTFIIKTPPTTEQIKKAAGIESGNPPPPTDTEGQTNNEHATFPPFVVRPPHSSSREPPGDIHRALHACC